MTRIKPDDLSPRARERLYAQLDKKPTRQTQRVGPNDHKAKWRCSQCEEICTTWRAVERHRDKERHYRYEQWTGDT